MSARRLRQILAWSRRGTMETPPAPVPRFEPIRPSPTTEVGGTAAAPDSWVPVDTAPLAMRALGSTTVFVEGRRVERWESLRGLMVLRYLAWSHPKPVSRDVLMALLWPDSSPHSARNSLNVAIHGLRASLVAVGAASVVVHCRGAYSIPAEAGFVLDAREFESTVIAAEDAWDRGDLHLARQLFESAIQLYGGPLFDDDSEGEWYLMDRRRLSDRYADALEGLAIMCHDDEDHRAAIDAGRALLAVDPCRESGHRLLMRAYAACGKHHYAARQYAECVTVLRSELAVAPDPSTTRLFNELLGSRAVEGC